MQKDSPFVRRVLFTQHEELSERRAQLQRETTMLYMGLVAILVICIAAVIVVSMK